MADFAYAVHTDVCTYLLDETGVCLWVLSPAHSTATAVKSCVGAHFVACVDTRVAGGLVGELVEGAAALFVSVNKETGRPSLLRTGVIRRVQERHPSQVQALLEPLLEDIDVHFEDDVSQRQTVATPAQGGARPAPPIASRESEATTRVFEMPSAKPAGPEIARRESQDLSSLDRPTEPRNSPLAETSSAPTEQIQKPSPAELPVAQPPPCPDLPEPQPPPVLDLPKAAPTLVIDLPKETAPQPDTADKPRPHGPPPLPKTVAHTPLPAPLPPPLPSGSMGHTPLPPPLPSGSMGHTPVPAPLPTAHTPGPPPLPKAALPPLPGQLTHTPLPPPLPKNPAHQGPPPLPGAQDRSPVPPPVWLTHASLPEVSPPALPLPPVVVGIDESEAETSKDLSADKEPGGKPGGSRIPKRKSSADNQASPPTLSSQRTRGSQPASRTPKQAGGKKIPPPPLPPPPRSISGARSSTFDENAPLPLRRRKKKD